MELQTYLLQDEIVHLITSEFQNFLQQYDAEVAKIQLPPIQKTKDTSKGDYTVMLKGACAKRKLDVVKYTEDLTVEFNKHLVSDLFLFFYFF